MKLGEGQMDFHLPAISCLKLDFTLSAVRDCILPKIKGSMLRGAVGHALKKTVCVIPKASNCSSCLLRSQCAYTRIFESFVEKNAPPLLKGVQTAPRPFVIDAFDEQTHFHPGEAFSFTFTLFGSACEFYPYVIYGVIRAGESGFSASRYPFVVEKVEENGMLIYDGKKKALLTKVFPRPIEITETLDEPVTLRFLTPTRIKQKGRLTVEFTFRSLVFSMVRRHLEMAYFYMPNAEVSWNFKELLNLAEKIGFSERKLHWVEWTRYSNRQDTRLYMGGFCGHLTLEGDVAPFASLLRSAEVLHVGKGTTLGMGKMKIENPL